MPEKTRVLALIDFLGNGGAETLLRTQAASFDRARFDLHIVGLRKARRSPLAGQLRDLHVPVTEFKQRNAYDIPALTLLIRYIQRHRIDIIHTHLLASDIMGRMAGFLTGVPVISTVHNSRKDFDKEPLRRQLMERWTGKLLSARMIVVTDLLRHDISDWYGVPMERVVAIPNGVDVDTFSRGPKFDVAAEKRLMLGGNYPLITNVARLVPEKAQDLLLKAARIVIDARPDARFVLVGDGPMRTALEAQTHELGLEGKVIFTGFRNKVSDILAATDIFVLSSHYEGLPVALLEAMAAGCVAICTDVGGVSQVIRNGENGLLVPPGNPSALAGTILGVLNDQARCERLAHTAHNWVEQEYGMRAWSAKLEKLYLEEIKLAKKRRRRLPSCKPR